MKIYLLDRNKEMTDAWHKYFDGIDDIKVVNSDFALFMNANPNIEAIVSPANSFGLMDGGYDKAISNYFGNDLQKKVQEYILHNCFGEQPVGTSISVPITNRMIYRQISNERTIALFPILIHTPTMRTPEHIEDERIVYQCMRTTLIEATRQKVHSIVIPAFCALTGAVPYDNVAKMMYLAYKQINNSPKELNWGYAWYVASELSFWGGR